MNNNKVVLGSPCRHCGTRLLVQRYVTEDGDDVYGRPENATTEHVSVVDETGKARCYDRPSHTKTKMGKR